MMRKWTDQMAKVGAGLLLVGVALMLESCTANEEANTSEAKVEVKVVNVMSNQVNKTDAEWRKELTSEQYHVLREKGTERPFTGEYWNTHDKGTYKCAACGAVLFASEAKFDSGCGWPSFDRPVSTNAVAEAADNSLFMHRTEVLCPKCGGHLGHVFDDGPRETTGMRYCINSVSLKFEPETNGPAKK